MEFAGCAAKIGSDSVLMYPLFDTKASTSDSVNFVSMRLKSIVLPLDIESCLSDRESSWLSVFVPWYGDKSMGVALLFLLMVRILLSSLRSCISLVESASESVPPNGRSMLFPSDIVIVDPAIESCCNSFNGLESASSVPS